MYVDSPKSANNLSSKFSKKRRVRCRQFIKHLKLEIAPPLGREMFSDWGSSESDYLVSRWFWREKPTLNQNQSHIIINISARRELDYCKHSILSLSHSQHSLGYIFADVASLFPFFGSEWHVYTVHILLCLGILAILNYFKWKHKTLYLIARCRWNIKHPLLKRYVKGGFVTVSPQFEEKYYEHEYWYGLQFTNALMIQIHNSYIFGEKLGGPLKAA